MPDTRTKLADAIVRHERARQRVDELEAAQPRAIDNQIHARHQRDRAAEALADVQRDAPHRLVNAMVDGGTTTISADQAVEGAEQALSRAATAYEIAQRATQAVDDQLGKAQADLRNARHRLSEAIGVVIADSDAVQRLLAEHADARRHLAGIEHALELLRSKNALPAAARLWNAFVDIHDHEFDPELRAHWEDALSKLEIDAEAPLPGDDD